VTKAKADMTVNATTWDNLAVVMGGRNPPNIKSLSGSALGSFEASLNLTGVAAGPIKAVKLRANLGADASATFDKPVSQMTAMAPGNIAISVNYKASASVAFSVALADGTGGKIVVTANSALDKTKAYPFGPGITTPDFNIEFVTATVSSLTLDVYDDAGTLKFTKVYADATALMTDFAPAP